MQQEIKSLLQFIPPKYKQQTKFIYCQYSNMIFEDAIHLGEIDDTTLSSSNNSYNEELDFLQHLAPLCTVDRSFAEKYNLPIAFSNHEFTSAANEFRKCRLCDCFLFLQKYSDSLTIDQACSMVNVIEQLIPKRPSLQERSNTASFFNTFLRCVISKLERLGEVYSHYPQIHYR